MKQKILYLEVLRIAALLGVIMIHVSSTFFLQYESLAAADKLFVVLMNSAGRFSVPVFVMVSGALALVAGRKVTGDEYITKRLYRLGLPLVFWSIVYLSVAAWQGQFANNPIGGPIEAVLAGQPYFHLYYLFVILGLSFITPFLCTLWQKLTARSKGWVVLITLLLAAGDAFVVQFWQGEYFLPSHNTFSFFVPFVGLFLLGAYLYEYNVSIPLFDNMKLNTITMLLVTMASVLIAIEIAGVVNGLYFNEYQSLSVVLYAAAVFLWARRSEDALQQLSSRAKRLLQNAGKAVFGVYLVHVLLLVAFRRLLLPADISGSLPHIQLLILVITLLISFVAVIIMQRIPLLRRVV